MLEEHGLIRRWGEARYGQAKEHAGK
jgi:hypothetical protein